MKYTIQHVNPSLVFLKFENGLEVSMNPKTGYWSMGGLRRPNLDDLQAIIGIVLEVLTLPVAAEDEKA